MTLTANLLLQGDFGPNVEPFLLHALIGGRQLTQLRKRLERILVTILGRQPARRERQEDDSNTQDETGNDLKQERKSPAPFRIHESRAVGNPVGDTDSSDDAELFEDEQGTANLGRRDFGDIEGRDHGEHTNANTTN
jgi:hypothetical protein